MDVKSVFDGAAASYDALRRQLIPCFDPFYDTAAELVALDPAVPARVLDVGAGTGLLAARIAARLPRAELTLLDFSTEMLAFAPGRLAAHPGGHRIVVGDYTREPEVARPPAPRPAPLGGPWDAVVSALSIHHLQDGEKRALYARVFEALRPGGVFVNADNVLAEDPAVAARDRAAWIEAVRRTGIAPAQLDAALERTRVDVLAPLALQLGWLRELGFREVDCAFKWRHFVVFSGVKPGAGGSP